MTVVVLHVDGIVFEFKVGWQTSKYDRWSFYRRRFGAMRDGIKAVDLLAVGPDRTAWFIEVKDYGARARTKPTELPHEVAAKVFDTLAALLPAKLNGDDANEIEFADSCLRARRLRVVLHLEQPAKHSKLFPRAIDPSVVELKLRGLIKAIDAHPVVVESTRMNKVEWKVKKHSRRDHG
jgi:hypothetical protein